MEASEEEATRALHPFVATQLEYLLKRSPLQMQVESVRRGTPTSHFADRFSLLVPCCLDYIKWDIVFNSEHPWLAPDIIFSADDDSFQPLIIADDSQESSRSTWSILRDWSIKDSSRLLRLIIELRALYLQHQHKLVNNVDDPRVRFEIGTISGMQGLEMCLLNGVDKSQEVKFSVPLLKMDLSELIKGYSSSLGLHEAIISLQVIFSLRTGQSAVPPVPQLKLFAPTNVKEVFDVEDVKLPVWPDGMCLAEYIPTLKNTLRRQVNEAFSSIALRRSFMEALLVPFGRPMEADTVFYRRTTVLASSGFFVFLVHFSLPIQFPKQQPYLTFQSSQHFDTQGKPITRVYKEYPWSPRWDTPLMVQRIFEFVVEECNNFKKYCNDLLQHFR